MQNTPIPDPVIEVRDLTRIYGYRSRHPFKAVDHVSFNVAPGQVFGLLGTNGAGKTSVLEIVEGLAAPSSGTVRVLGMDPLADRARIRPHQGAMLQSGGLPEALTVDETLQMWRGTCSAPLATRDIMDKMQLGHLKTTKVGALSGGEQRRVDLACALIADPQVLFLDEPTTGLDPESRRHVWSVLGELKQRGVTMMLTTHYLEEAEQLSDRIAIMNQGRIEVEGTVDELTNTLASQLTFTLPQGAPPPPDVADAAITRTGDTFTVRTLQPQHDSLAILAWAEHNGIALTGFSVRPASLEQVFHGIANAANTSHTLMEKGNNQ